MKSFLKKIIFSKIFFGVWFARKNYKMRKYNCSRNPATSGRCCWIPTSTSGRCCWIPTSTFGRIRPKLLDSDRTPPDHVRSGRIPVILAKFGRIHPGPARCCWIPTTNHCQISAIEYQTCLQGRRV
jgi:hypothetical protein